MSRKLKVLVITNSPISEQSIESFYKNAFEDLGHNVKITSIKQSDGFISKARRRVSKFTYQGFSPNEKGLAAIKDAEIFNPDLTIVFRGEDLIPESIAYLNKISSIGCINIYTDSPFVIPGIGAAKLIPAFSEYSAIYTFSKSLVPVFQQLGGKNVKRLCFGFDRRMHKIEANINFELKSTVSYFGTWGILQEAWLASLMDLYPLKIFGPGWENAQQKKLLEGWVKGAGVGSGMKRAIYNADIVFNLIRAEHGCAHSMKTFEIPACGGFMLTNWTEEQAEFFEADKHCVYFQSVEEMIDKVKFFSSHSVIRDEIAYQGHKVALEYPYTKRVQEL